jgi:microcystin-dependent protein
MDGYLGTVLPMGINFAPRNWVNSEGQSLPIQQYAALYSLMGILYGGDGRTNFGLPNLKGRFPLGMGMTPGTSENYSQGATGGASHVTLTANNLPPHIHPAAASVSMSGMTVSLPPFSASATTNTTLQVSPSLGTTANPADGNYLSGLALTGSPGSWSGKIYSATPLASSVSLAGAVSDTTVTVTPNGTASVSGSAAASVTVGPNPTSNSSVLTIPPYTALRFIICVNGLFPARN